MIGLVCVTRFLLHSLRQKFLSSCYGHGCYITFRLLMILLHKTSIIFKNKNWVHKFEFITGALRSTNVHTPPQIVGSNFSQKVEPWAHAYCFGKATPKLACFTHSKPVLMAAVDETPNAYHGSKKLEVDFHQLFTLCCAKAWCFQLCDWKFSVLSFESVMSTPSNILPVNVAKLLCLIGPWQFSPEDLSQAWRW